MNKVDSRGQLRQALTGNPAAAKTGCLSCDLEEIFQKKVGSTLHCSTRVENAIEVLGYPDNIRGLDSARQRFASVEAICKVQKQQFVKWTCFVDPRPDLYVPALTVIQLMAKRYEEKYGILIRLCHSDHLNSAIFELLKSGTAYRPVGIIVWNESGACKTPIIIHLIKGRHCEMIMMDPAGSRAETMARLINCASTMRQGKIDMRLFLSDSLRHTDKQLGFIGALVILRNALLHVKHNGHTFNSFESLLTVEGKIQGDFVAVSLPPEWTYTDQLLPEREDGGKSLVIRDLFSQREEKRTQPKTCDEFRKCHTVTHVYRATLQYNGGAGDFTAGVAQEGIIFRHGDPNSLFAASAEWTGNWTRNDYLTSKARKLAAFAAKITSQTASK